MELLPEKEKQKILRLKHKTTQQEISEAEDLLKDWQSTVNKKDIELQKATKLGDSDDSSSIFTSATMNKNLPPVRGSASIESSDTNKPKKVYFDSQSKEDSPSSKEEKAPERLSGYDFRAWEKYDADKEADKIREFEQPFFDTKPGRSMEELHNEVGAKRAAAHQREMDQIQSELGAGGLSMLQRTTRANREKIKGNECFKIGEMEEAFACYSRSLALDATNAITYANRAMTSLRLSKLELAEDDCSRSLSIDPTYVKAWSRRGSTRFKRGKYKEAVRDFEEALKLTSSDSPGREELLNLARTAREKYMEVEGKHLPSSDGNITPYTCDSLDAFAKKALPPSSAECVSAGKCTVVHFAEETEESRGTRIAISVESDSEHESDAEDVPKTSNGNEESSTSGFRRIAIVEESDSEDEDEANEAKAIELKDEANELVKASKNADAELLYTEALGLCQEGSSTALAVLNNRSRVRISLGNFSAAAQDAAGVLEHEPGNLKALYRSAISNHRLWHLEDSLANLKKLLALDSTNKQAAELMEVVTTALAAASSASTGVSEQTTTSLKDQGNSAMVAKRYEEALGLYSEAISLEKGGASEARAILLSNRSQAYLKLERYAEAESDANDAIEILEKGSAESAGALCKKAIFRRALAYQGMGGMMHLNASIADLESLVAEDPGNKSFKKELAVSQALLKEKGGKVASSSPKIDGPITTMPPVPPQDLGMKETKTTKRSTTSSSAATAAPTPPEPPIRGKTSATPPVTSSSVAKERSPQPKVVATKRPSVPTEAPKTVYELEKVWRALKSYPDLLAEYLAIFKKGTYKKVFKETVSPDLLSSVFSALRDHASPEVVTATLQGLGNIPSFSMVSVLLPAEDLAVAREALDKVDDVTKREELRKKFS